MANMVDEDAFLLINAASALESLLISGLVQPLLIQEK